MGNRISELYSASNFLYTLKEDFFDSDEMEFSMDMFGELCNHVKNTYQLIYNTENKTELLHALKVHSALTQIAYYAEMIDIEHECISMLALIAVLAIGDIVCLWSEPDKFVYHRNDVLLYDFENDTPEDVFNRIKGFLITEDGGFLTAEDAYFLL